MNTVLSADGTPIAFTRVGDGPAVVIVNGAFSTAADAAEIAAQMADVGLTAVTYDRRARGSSGDTRPSPPEREVDDLAAVIAATGGRAAVLGHSSGAVLALYAASLGASIDHLFLSEPPFRFGEDEPAPDLAERLQAAVDEGRPEDAVTAFQLEGVGLPPLMVEQIRSSPMFPGLVALAQSTVYDAALTRLVSTPTPAMLAVTVPIDILCGVETFPMLIAAGRGLAAAIPHATLIDVPESVGHRPDPVATAKIIEERWG